MRTAFGIVRLVVYVAVAGPLLAYLQLTEIAKKRKRYASQGFREVPSDLPQHQAEGVGPRETARLKELFRLGTLAAYCTRVLDVPGKARALVERRRKP